MSFTKQDISLSYESGSFLLSVTEREEPLADSTYPRGIIPFAGFLKGFGSKSDITVLLQQRSLLNVFWGFYHGVETLTEKCSERLKINFSRVGKRNGTHSCRALLRRQSEFCYFDFGFSLGHRFTFLWCGAVACSCPSENTWILSNDCKKKYNNLRAVHFKTPHPVLWCWTHSQQSRLRAAFWSSPSNSWTLQFNAVLSSLLDFKDRYKRISSSDRNLLCDWMCHGLLWEHACLLPSFIAAPGSQRFVSKWLWDTGHTLKQWGCLVAVEHLLCLFGRDIWGLNTFEYEEGETSVWHSDQKPTLEPEDCTEHLVLFYNHHNCC